MSIIQERDIEKPALPRTPDVLSEILGARTYARRHRFGVRLQRGAAQSPKLSVSRFYFDTDPPTAVDFVPEIKRGKAEVLAKYTYCEVHGIRYILLASEWDEEGLTDLLQIVSPESFDAAGPPADLLIAPRKGTK
jgi:hypothetical protein